MFSELAVAYLFFGGRGGGHLCCYGRIGMRQFRTLRYESDLSHYKEIAAPFDSVGAKKLASAP